MAKIGEELGVHDPQHFKFTAIVGNPPYHYEAGRRKIPLYQVFVTAGSSKNVTDVACFVTPDGFIKGGQQLEPLRKYLVNNRHLKSVDFYQKPIFDNVAVNAAITLFDNRNDYASPQKTIINEDGSVEVSTLDWKYRDVIADALKYSVLCTYQNMIKRLRDNDISGEFGTMEDIIPGWAPFGLNTKCYKSNKDKFKTSEDDRHNIRILVNEDGRDFYWIDKNDDFSYLGSDGRIEFVKTANIEKWKMVFPKAGTVNAKPLRTYILGPNEIFTDKYLCIFADSEQAACNAEKYFSTKFYRAGLHSYATSWNLYRNWHCMIPLQDFTANSDIDWSKPLADIDQQLYKKYGFSADEIANIESLIN